MYLMYIDESGDTIPLTQKGKKFLGTLPITLYSVVIDKDSYWKQYPVQNPYYIAYIFLMERFQKFLEEKDGLEICIIDLCYAFFLVIPMKMGINSSGVTTFTLKFVSISFLCCKRCFLSKLTK